MNGKNVLVTGASRGIGKSIALKFAKEGYNLIITCHNKKEELLKTKKEIENFHVNCFSFVGDLGDYSVVENLFNRVGQEVGTVDILINNAGISHIGLFTDMKVEDWNQVIQTNLSSVFHCCKFVVPHMIHKKEGRIINLSSLWGVCGASCEVAYSTSKGGINAFTKSLAKELAPSNIQVNAIACGAIDTDMNMSLDKEEKKAIINEIPANRFGQPWEVADFVYTIATGHEYLTGQVIAFDGAWL